MKRFLKKVLTFTLLLCLLVSLTGCKKDSTKDEGTNNDSVINSESIKSINKNNYTAVITNNFGLTIKENKGWTINSAKSPNGVDNVMITFNVNDGIDAKLTLKDYFEQAKALAKDGIYNYKYNENYTAVSKDKRYTDFNTFYKENSITADKLSQIVLIYDYNDKTIQLVSSIDDKKAEITLSIINA